MERRKLNTIQKRGKRNNIYPNTADTGAGGAYYSYMVSKISNPLETITIQFKKNSRMGVTESDLLEIVRDRLRTFQASERACRENACAITHVEEALMWLNKRAEEKEKKEMKHDKEALYKAGVAKFGAKNQIQKTVEELAELIQALCKYTFDTSNLWAIDNIRGEWADVEIMLGQLRVIFGDNSQVLDSKLDHLAELVKEQ